MTTSSRLTKIGLLGLAALFLAGTSRAQQRPPIVEQLAKTYGLDSYGQLDAVRYTFNLQLPALKVNLSRTWTWEPKTGQVTYEAKDKDGKPVKVTYNRNQLSSAPDNVKNDIEPGFVNDNYWFMFPFHVYWDTSAVVTVKEKQKLPLGKGTATLVSVKYPAEVGGYTPGDTWDLFVGSDGRVKEFTYHRGGPKKPSLLSTTWAGYEKAGPLLVSTDHRGVADGQSARIFFSGVAYKLASSNAWLTAQ
ncbi:MAG TPA: hypothetical protein VEH49_06900 [Methylomirabilota bacterium]|nr:hypothetical protein [Methylomirabilota bacterium]